MSSKEIKPLNWGSVEVLIGNILTKLKKDNRKIESIAGIPRGGLIPAVMVSHRLDIPLVDYRQSTQTTLVVDDIVDTGKTIQDIKLLNIPTAALITRSTSPVNPTYSGVFLETEEWVIFPWEDFQAERIQDYLKN